MVIGEKLKALREQKNMSQGDIEKRTGLLRCYISRVENDHTVPAVDTLEKLARALEVPMYRLFTDEDHVKKPNMPAETIRSRAVRSKQERTSGFREITIADGRQGPWASVSHGVEDGEPGLIDMSVEAITLGPSSFIYETRFTDRRSVLKREIGPSCILRVTVTDK